MAQFFRKLKMTQKNFRLFFDLAFIHRQPYVAKVAKSSEEIYVARKLHADTYMRLGMIDDSHLDSSGLIKKDIDKFIDRSTYFIVKDRRTNKIVVSARLIKAENNNYSTLQVNVDSLDRKTKNEFENLSGEIYEFASLVKAKGTPTIATILLYKEVLDYSKSNVNHVWIFGLNEKINPAFASRFGHSLHRLSGTAKLGSFSATFIPYVVKPNMLTNTINRLYANTPSYKLPTKIKFYLLKRVIN